jgi:hypothetical protein
VSGILDNKSRIIDVILTQEGRRQLASGDLRIRFATFTDAGTFYEADSVSGSMDATSRVFFEACSLPQDQITFEADDSGRLLPFGAQTPFELRQGQLSSRTYSSSTSSTIQGSSTDLVILSGSTFASTMEGILTGSIDGFSKLRVIGSYDALFEDDDFSVGPTRVLFPLTDRTPIATDSQTECNINDLESLFNDPRLARAKNFAYLPPVNRKLDGQAPTVDDRIGDYAPWGGVRAGRNPREAYETLRRELATYDARGMCKSFSFDPTSRDNTLVGQLFELTDRSATKLDVIHYGTFSTQNTSSPVADVFFAGKVIVDDRETQSFVHLFTLVFE